MNINSNIKNVDLQFIFNEIASNIHDEAKEIRKSDELKNGNIAIYSSYLIYPSDDGKYYAFHYVVHVDEKTERFYVVTWIETTEDEYLDFLKFN